MSRDVSPGDEDILGFKTSFLGSGLVSPLQIKRQKKKRRGRELDVDVEKTDSEKMVHKFRTLESDLDSHSYNQRMPLQNLEKCIGSFLKKQTYLQNSFKRVYHLL